MLSSWSRLTGHLGSSGDCSGWHLARGCIKKLHDLTLTLSHLALGAHPGNKSTGLADRKVLAQHGCHQGGEDLHNHCGGVVGGLCRPHACILPCCRVEKARLLLLHGKGLKDVALPERPVLPQAVPTEHPVRMVAPAGEGGGHLQQRCSHWEVAVCGSLLHQRCHHGDQPPKALDREREHQQALEGD